jgi:hypothetical protein
LGGRFKGERYDFILTAGGELKTYWIRAKGFADCSNYGVFERALLFYENGLDQAESNLKPLVYNNASRNGIVSFNFENLINFYYEVVSMETILSVKLCNITSKYPKK